jgi:hypothetical protein
LLIKSIAELPARSVTTGQIRAEAASPFVRFNDTTVVIEANVRSTVTSIAIAAIPHPVVAAVNVDRRPAVEETAIDTEAASVAEWPVADRTAGRASRVPSIH